MFFEVVKDNLFYVFEGIKYIIFFCLYFLVLSVGVVGFMLSYVIKILGVF